jgi:hypothetical protein
MYEKYPEETIEFDMEKARLVLPSAESRQKHGWYEFVLKNELNQTLTIVTISKAMTMQVRVKVMGFVPDSPDQHKEFCEAEISHVTEIEYRAGFYVEFTSNWISGLKIPGPLRRIRIYDTGFVIFDAG